MGYIYARADGRWRNTGLDGVDGDVTMTTRFERHVRDSVAEWEWRGWLWKGLRDWTSHLSILATGLAGGVRWQWKPSVLGICPLSSQARRGVQGAQSEGDSVVIML